MSGGHFYNKYAIISIAEDINEIILKNDNNDTDQYGDRIGSGFSEETIDKLKETMLLLSRASKYVDLVDYLLCGDIGEDTFNDEFE